MKSIKLGDVIKWGHEEILYECRGMINLPAAVLSSLEEKSCPHCGNPVAKDEIVSITSSPQFQENANPATFEDLKKLVRKLQPEIQKTKPEPIKSGLYMFNFLREKYCSDTLQNRNYFQIFGMIEVKYIPHFPPDILMIGDKVFRIEETKLQTKASS